MSATCPEFASVDELIDAARRDAKVREDVVGRLLAEGSEPAREVVVAIFIPQVLRLGRRARGVDHEELVSFAFAALGRYVTAVAERGCPYSAGWYIARSMHRDVYRQLERMRSEAQRRSFANDQPDPFENMPTPGRVGDRLGSDLAELVEWIATETTVSFEDASLIVWASVTGAPLKHGCSPSEAVRRFRCRNKIKAELTAAASAA